MTEEREFPAGRDGDGRVLLRVAEGVATVTIDRVDRHNAMSFGIMQGLRDAVAAVRADDDARVLVLTGAGDRAFCSGADLGGIGDEIGRVHV